MMKMSDDRPHLYYETYGRGHPLLLISGLNSDNASWAGVRDALARSFRVIIFDNRSSGRSYTPNKRYSIRDMADDAIGLLDRLGVRKCHIIGHSMGGYIAQELAIRHPGRVGRLVLEATASVSSKRNNMLFEDLLNRYTEDGDKEELMRRWTYWLFSPKTFERKNYIEKFIEYAAGYRYFQSAEGFNGQIDAIRSFDARGRIGKIRARTLVVIGSDDILIYPAESMQLAMGIGGSVCEEVKNAGHCVHVEKPGIFVSKAVKFLI